MQQFSTFAGCVESDEEDSDCMQHITEFIAGEYLNILESAKYHVIYHYDARWPQLGRIFDNDSQYEDFADAGQDVLCAVCLLLTIRPTSKSYVLNKKPALYMLGCIGGSWTQYSSIV